MINDTLLWQVRHFVYNHFVDPTHPPSVDDTAAHFNISTEEAGEYYKELDNRHAFFLDPGTLNVRMAWPFSAIPTDFKVHANGKTYYGNCAWDMLGIPALLQCDAAMDAKFTESNEPIQLKVKDGNIYALGGVPAAEESAQNGYGNGSNLLIHFPVAFSHWYDDLVFT